ncbi:MAG: DNA recombination protein RmuC [Nitrospirae bacterium]|nr:DNA recombination protein RmuC [Nitrospirota bacterium]
MTTIAYIILGIIIGGISVWFFTKARSQRKITDLEKRASSAEAVIGELRQQIQMKDNEINQIRKELKDEGQLKIEALTRLGESQKNLEEQKSLLEEMKKEMTNTFNALSKAALESSNEIFLSLASERLGKVVEETKGKLGEHQATMDGLIRPLQEALKRYEEQTSAIEAKRRQDYGGIEEQIKMLASTHQQLQRETSSLVTALRKPQVSGSWGQLSLKRTAELAGMTAYCDFYEQESVTTETGRLRPDMIVRLPNGREIVVDAKAPVDAYLNAISVSSEEERQKALTSYVNQVRAHMNALGSKSYWDQFPKSPEIVVMYLPGESFFSAALEHDNKLIEDSSIKKVILATPTTFIALLKAIAYGWQQEQLTKNAQQISMLGKELYERINTLVKHFDDIGSAIRKAMDSYNKVVGSMELRVLPSVRKFKELGVTGAGEIPVLDQIDHTPRSLNLLQSDNNNQEDK